MRATGTFKNGPSGTHGLRAVLGEIH